jgi:hypothetical protein
MRGLLLTLALLAFACSTAGLRGTASSASSAAGLLAQDLSNRVRILERPIFAFNYSRGEPRSSESAIRKHLETTAAYYGDTTVGETGVAMPGLYLAVDPLASREFGGMGTDWLLYRLELPQGLRYVDISLTSSDRLPEHIVKALAAEGCVATGEYLDRFDYSALLKQNPGPACRRIAKAALDAHGATALAYSYAAYNPQGCAGTRQLAIILFELTALTSASIRELSVATPLPSSAASEERFIEQLFAETGYQGWRLWPALDGKPIDQAKFAGWKKARILNCQ